MNRITLFILGLLSASAFGAAPSSSSADPTDANASVGVREIHHVSTSDSIGKTAPGPSDLIKSYGEDGTDQTAVKPTIVYLPKAGAEK